MTRASRAGKGLFQRARRLFERHAGFTPRRGAFVASQAGFIAFRPAPQAFDLYCQRCALGPNRTGAARQARRLFVAGARMKTLKAVIAEDEPVLREELRRALAGLWPELLVCAEAPDGVEALKAVDAHAPDILFLDIEMPGMSGLEVARFVGGKCHVVFVTAYDKYAVAAFEQGAIDYVMKPFSQARIATALARIKERVASAPANLDGLLKALAEAGKGTRACLRWITASVGGEIRLITVEEICYFQADNKCTLVITADAESVIRRTIRGLHSELDQDVFWQIHRSTLVNINAVSGVHRDLGGQLRVRLKHRPETLLVSSTYALLFKQM
jgi:DNA-binding LytR/AlgR family response regulator